MLKRIGKVFPELFYGSRQFLVQEKEMTEKKSEECKVDKTKNRDEILKKSKTREKLKNQRKGRLNKNLTV